MSTKRTFIALAGVAVALVTAIGCGRMYKAAPDCSPGQALVFNNGAYACQFVYVNPSGSMVNPYMVQQNSNLLAAPALDCKGDPSQRLVDWKVSGQADAWYCIHRDFLDGQNQHAPVTATPPPQRGGEYCTSVGYGVGSFGNYGYNPAYTMTGIAANMIGCTPGYTCVATAQAAASPDPSNYWGPWGATSVGQPGSCQFTGYRPY